MAKSVEEKVVQLTLDNKQFNKASDDTIDSLEKLKKSLEFEGAVDSFDTLEKEIKHVDFSPMEKEIDGVGKSFTILDTITDTIFRNITNRIINTGEQMIKSLSTDQIMTGWEKYAEQTGAVQTIMAATAQQFSDTGKQMDVVNSQLEKLTWFTDETSHKFNDMVGGIGKFTANNIDLEVSVKAMEGIATWASLSGANANEASRAIYNLAQAVSVGSVKLIDWRSIENANMGTTEFKQTVIETAEEVGSLIKVTDGLWSTLNGKQVSIANFSENLSEGWFNADVLLKSLDKYGNFADRLNQFTEETGALTASLIEIIDDYADGTLNMSEAMKITGMTAEELTPWLEELGSAENDLGRRAFKAAQETKTFQEAIDYVKEAVSSGWATSFKYIFGDYLEAKEWWSEIAEVMYDAFVVGGEIRNTILSMWKDDGGRDDFLDGIREVIENVMDLVQMVKNVWNETWFGKDDENNTQLKNMAKALLNVTKQFLEFAKAIKPTEETSDNLQKILKSVFSILKTGATVIKAIATGLSPIAELLNIISGTLLEFIANAAEGFSSGLTDFFNADRLNAIASALRIIATVVSGVLQVGLAAIMSLLSNIGNLVQIIFTRIQENGGGIRGLITALIEIVRDFFNAFIEGETIANKVVNGILFIFGGLAAGIKAIIDTIFGLITGELTFGDIFSGNGGITDAVTGFGKILDDMQIRDKVANIISWVKDFCEELVAADGIIVNFVVNVTDAIAYLWDRLKGLLSQLTIDDIKDLLLIAILWQFISGINSINKSLSSAISNFGGIAKSFNQIVAKFTENNTVMDKLTGMFKAAKFLQMGIAVTLLVAALGKLNTLDYEKTQQSVAALGVTLAILLAAMKVFSKILNSFPKKENKLGEEAAEQFDNFAKNMLLISASALMIAQAMKVMEENMFDEEGNFDWRRYAAALIGLSTVMTALALVTKVIKTIDGSAVGNIVTIVSIAAGIRLLVGSLVILAAIDDYAKMFVACAGVSGIILALGGAVRIMQGIDWKSALSLVPTMLAFATALTTITAAIGIFSKALDAGDSAQAIIVYAAEVAGLAGSIAILGKTLKKTPPATLLSIAAAMDAFALAIVGIAGAMLMVSTIDMSKSSASLLALGAGFTMIATALGVLGTVLQTVSASTITSIGLAMIEMSGAILILAGALKIIQGITWESIQTGVLTIGAIVGVFSALAGIVAFFDVQTFGMVSKSIETLSDAFLKFSAAIAILSAGIFALAAAAGVMATIIAAFQALADKLGIDLPLLIEQGFDTLELIIREFLQMLGNLAPDFLATFIMLFGMISLAIAAVKHPTATAIAGLIIAMADEIARHGQEMVNALVTIVNFINSATELFEALKELAYHIGDFVGGAIIEALHGMLDGVAGSIVEWITPSEEDIARSLNKQYNEALEKMADENTNEIARMQGFKTMEGIIQGWIDGEVDLNDEAVNAALAAMDEFTESASGSAKESATQILGQLSKGIADNKDGFADQGGIMAKYFRDDGWIKAQDPKDAMDSYREDAQDIKTQIGYGVNDIADDVAGFGASLGFDFGEGFENAAKAKINDALSWLGNLTGGTKLVTGYSSSSTPKVNKKTQGAMKKAAQFLEIPDDVKKEVEQDYQETGESNGSTYIDSVGSGIKKSGGSGGKAAKAAKEEAKSISDAFSDELDKINRESQISDKLFSLWKAQNPDATELEVTAKEIEYQSQKVAIATQKASISQQIYQQTLEEMGESAKETHEAYMQMLDDQIALSEAQNKLDELQKNGATATSSTARDQVEAFKALNGEFKKMYAVNEKNGQSMVQFLQSLGATQEDIARIAADNVGYNMPAKIESAANEVLSDSAIATTNVVSSFVDNTFNEIENVKPELKEKATELPGVISEGVADGSTKAEQSNSFAVEQVFDRLKADVDGNAKGFGESIKSIASSISDTSQDTVANIINDSFDINNEKFGSAITNFGEKLSTSLNDNFKASFEFDAFPIAEAISAATEEAQPMSDPIIREFGQWTIETTASSIVENKDILTNSFVETFDAPLGYFKTAEGHEKLDLVGNDVTTTVGGAIEKRGDIINESYIKVFDAPLNYFNSGEGKEKLDSAGESVIKTVATSMIDNSGTLVDYVVELANIPLDYIENGEGKATLEYIGETSISTVGNSMLNNSEMLIEPFATTMDTPLNYFKTTGYLKYDELGNSVIMHTGDSMVESASVLTDALNTTMDVPLNDFNTVGYLKWEEMGTKIDTSIVSGANASAGLVSTTLKQVGSNAYDSLCQEWGINGIYSEEFYQVGIMVDDGLAAGIESGQSKVINAAIQVAEKALAAAKNKLGIASPSKEMMEVGRYFDMGLMIGIDDYANKVVRSVSDMTTRLRDVADTDLANSAAIKSLSELVDISEDDLHMTIVMDADAKGVEATMSQIEKVYYTASSNLGGFLNQNLENSQLGYLISRFNDAIEYQTDRIANLYSGIVQRTASEVKPVSNDETERITNVTLTQNNYSPKAISRVEIYRDTKRQLDTFARKFSASKL